MGLDLVGTKFLVVQIKTPLLPGVKPEKAVEEFLRLLQVPYAFARGVEVSTAIIDPAAELGLNGGRG